MNVMDNEFTRLVEQYMLMDKKTLAELLALKEMTSRQDMPVIPSYPATPSVPWPWPWYPENPWNPWWPQVWYTTTSNGKEYENWNPPKREGEFKCELNRHDVVENTRSDDFIDRLKNMS